MKAKCVFPQHDSWVGDSRIYQLDVPYQGFTHIAVVRHEVEYGQWQNAGVEVIGCNADGLIPGNQVVAVYQNYVVMTHAEVLAELGYTEEAS